MRTFLSERASGDGIYSSVYLLYWYKRTNADAVRRITACSSPACTQFTCFTGTNVHMLTLRAAIYLACIDIYIIIRQRRLTSLSEVRPSERVLLAYINIYIHYCINTVL